MISVLCAAVRRRFRPRRNVPRPLNESAMQRILWTELTRLAACAIAAAFVLSVGGGALAQERVSVFAAASTGAALEEAAAVFREQGGGPVVVVPAATSSLVRQIENGAPANLFVSAAIVWMDRLGDAGLLAPASRRALAGNRLVVIAPADSEVSIGTANGAPLGATIVKALGDSRLAVGDPDHVPAGIYAKEALMNLGVWPQLADRLARGGDVTAALSYVARGETALGIVYRSDAIATARVRVVAKIPAASHTPILYEVAAIGAAPGAAAMQFLAFLFGDEAQAVFAAHGFAPPPTASAR